MSEGLALRARERREEGQDEDADGACQHHLNRILGQKEEDARDAAADVRGDMTGAHQHHQLDRLVVVVPLGAAAGLALSVVVAMGWWRQGTSL